MTHSYPSDISHEQFNKIRPVLESVCKKTRPRSVDLFDVFCGVLYILKSGCQWRMLPIEYPKWELCYYYFRLWSKKNKVTDKSVLEIILKKIGWRGQKSPWSTRANQFCNH